MFFLFHRMGKLNKNEGGYSRLTKTSFIELKKDGSFKLRAHYFDRVEDI